MLPRAADFPFGDEGPVVLAGAVVEQALESGADGGFVGDAKVVELAQGGVVILDRLVRGLQFQPLHGGVLHRGVVDGNAGLNVTGIEMKATSTLSPTQLPENSLCKRGRQTESWRDRIMRGVSHSMVRGYAFELVILLALARQQPARVAQ